MAKMYELRVRHCSQVSVSFPQTSLLEELSFSLTFSREWGDILVVKACGTWVYLKAGLKYSRYKLIKNQILSQDQLLCSVAGNLIGTCTCTWCLSHLSAHARHRCQRQKTNNSLAHDCCVWQLVCISALWKGRQHRAKWNYIVDCGRTHRNTTHLSHVLSYFPSCNPTLRMLYPQTSTRKDVIFHV